MWSVECGVCGVGLLLAGILTLCFARTQEKDYALEVGRPDPHSMPARAFCHSTVPVSALRLCALWVVWQAAREREATGHTEGAAFRSIMVGVPPSRRRAVRCGREVAN